MAKLNASELDCAHKELKNEAKHRIVERGLLQFRADPDTVKAVLEEAAERNMPVGAMLRQWVQERLMLETGKQKAPDLVQRVIMLEESVIDIKRQLAK